MKYSTKIIFWGYKIEKKNLLVLSDYICSALKSLFHLNKYFLKYKWHLILGFIFIVFSNYFGVYMPKIIDQAADELLKHVAKKMRIPII